MTLITKQDELIATYADIDSSSRFALDLEFIPEKTFRPVLALLQIATANNVYIIDPLANLELMGVWQRVADPAILKVLHAGREDLNIIGQLSGLIPQNIFDTQVAAGFLGFGYPVGYKKLLAQILNIQIDKSESFTDWLARPLSKLQIQYAFEDVYHLLPLADRLVDMLKKRDRLDWVFDECAFLFSKTDFLQSKDYGFTRIKGARALSRRKLAVLQTLCALRTEEAKSSNKPLKAILSDISLLELSRRSPTDTSMFDEMRGINLDQTKRLGKKIIAAIEQAHALPETEWPVWPEMEMVSDGEALAGDLLYAVLKIESFDQQIAPELLATRAELQKLITYYKNNCHGEKKLSVLQGWRDELIGKKLLTLLDGLEIKIKVDLQKDAPVQILF